jgi:hypothetical protein
LSSAKSRVSETVSTAIFSGTKFLLSSIPGMKGSPRLAHCTTQ